MRDYSLDPETQAAAVKALIEAFDAYDDEELRLSLAEGETSLIEAIAQATRQIDDDQIMLMGLKERADELRARKDRIEKRVDARRAAIEQAMLMVDLPKIELSFATLSLRKTPPHPIITDEAAIPAEFWKRGDPQLDRKALKDALQGDAAVPGAYLSSGGVALQIRKT